MKNPQFIKSVISFLISSLISISILSGQVWTKNIDVSVTDIFYHVIQTSDEGYLAIGSADVGMGVSGHTEEAYLSKYDKYGEVEWTQIYGGNSADVGRDVIETPEGDFIAIAGVEDSLEHRVLDIRKFSSDGTLLWDKRYSKSTDITAVDIVAAGDGDFMIGCNARCDSCTVGFYSLYFVKINTDGDTLWMKEVSKNPDSYDLMEEIKLLPDGGFLFSGVTDNSTWASSTPNNQDFYWGKVDSEGNKVWDNSISFPYEVELLTSIEILPIGGYAFFGIKNPFTLAEEEVIMLKTFEDGSVDEIFILATTDQYQGYNYGLNYAVGSTLTDDGNIMVGVGSRYLFHLIKVDESGNVLWEKAPEQDTTFRKTFWDMQGTLDGGFIMVGYNVLSSGINEDFYLIKTDANGGTTNVFEIEKKQPIEIKVFPNPATDVVTFEIDNLKKWKEIKLKIFDIKGKIIYQQRIDDSEFDFNLKSFHESIFLYQLENESNQIIASGKISKM